MVGACIFGTLVWIVASNVGWHFIGGPNPIIRAVALDVFFTVEMRNWGMVSGGKAEGIRTKTDI